MAKNRIFVLNVPKNLDQHQTEQIWATSQSKLPKGSTLFVMPVGYSLSEVNAPPLPELSANDVLTAAK
jgi:hypothetical protein